MSMKNCEEHKKILTDARDFLLGLQNYEGKLMYQTGLKTGFVGWALSTNSFLKIFDSLVAAQEAPLTYLLAYKFSQDHLELFFSAVRSRGGFNDNPTALQFKAAYKRLLLRHNIKHGNGNCALLDDTNILHVNAHSISSINIARKYDLLEKEPAQVR